MKRLAHLAKRVNCITFHNNICIILANNFTSFQIIVIEICYCLFVKYHYQEP